VAGDPVGTSTNGHAIKKNLITEIAIGRSLSSCSADGQIIYVALAPIVLNP
jgi:hypothetical protein